MAGGGQTQLADPLMGQNHFTAVRWVLAIAVVLGHIWLLTTGFEPFRIHEWTASYMAVNGFFVLSGLLIAKSLHTRRDIKAYAVSRFLRIYPALVIILAAFVLVFAPVYSAEGGGSLFQPETWQYTYKVLALGDPDSAPAQIFSQNLETDFNGPLWTIRFELAAYILAGIAFMFGAVNGPWRVLSVFLLVQSVYLGAPLFIDTSALPPSVMSLLRLSSAFLLGMTLWQWPILRRPPLLAVAGLIAAFALLGGGPLGELFATLALTSLMLRAGLPKRASVRIAKIPDYSYGIYIWHYPLLQVFLVGQPDLSPAVLAIMTAPLILLVAATSWHVIEKPVLALKLRARPINQKTVSPEVAA